MSFSTDWDVDFYKTDYESDEHWKLRKAFIEAHKDKFAENEIVCLAQVFTNIEFLGCRYPEKTMQRVAHLSKEVADNFRKSRETKIKRTFVGASDAAGAKAKGRGSQVPKPIVYKNVSIPSLKNTFKKTESNLEKVSPDANKSENIIYQNKRKATADDDAVVTDLKRPFGNSTRTQTTITHTHKAAFSAPPQTHSKHLSDTGFIIFETISGQTQSMNILQLSAAKQGAIVRHEMEVDKNNKNKPLTCVVYINDKIYASVPIKTNKKDAKTEACNTALDNARQIHYTIKQKEINESVEVACQQEKDITSQDNNKSETSTIDSDNKGFKMMKMLGWTGGALGVSGNGIEQPVSIEMKVDRKGLGLSSDSSKLNHDFFVQYLTKYKVNETATYELVFSKDFSKDERKTLHEIANRLGLRSRSRNDPCGARFLVIHKKVNLLSLANDILNNGLQAKYYELIPPKNSLLPQKTLSQEQQLPQPKPTTNAFGFNYEKAKKKYMGKKGSFKESKK